MQSNNSHTSIVLNPWTNVRAFYIYDGTLENPQLLIDLQLNVSAYQPSEELEELADSPSPEVPSIPVWQQNALDDQRSFSRIYFDTEQNNGETADPELQENTVSVYLSNSLVKSEKSLLSPGDTQIVRTFIMDCLEYVTKRAAGLDGETPPAARLKMAVSPKDLSAPDLIKLDVLFTFEQIAPEPVATVSTDPATPEADVETNYKIEDLPVLIENSRQFADNFEPIFDNEQWQLKIGKTAVQPGLLGARQKPAYYAVRLGKKSGIGFYYEIEKEENFYASSPISKTLKTAAFPISLYETGKSFPADQVETVFSNIDLNEWANTALNGIDTILSFAVSSRGAGLFALPEVIEFFAKVRRYRQSIAASIADTLIPVLNAKEKDEISLKAARELFRSILSDNLSDAFTATAVTVLRVSNVSQPLMSNSAESSQLKYYGKLESPAATSQSAETDKSIIEKPSADYSLKNGAIEYFKSENEEPGSWRLPILFTDPNHGSRSAVRFPLSFALTHLEFNQMQVPENYNELPDKWIEFVIAPPPTPIGNNSVEFPVILRDLPAVPNLTFQTAEPHLGPADINVPAFAPEELAYWNYSFSYECRSSARDHVRLSISSGRQNNFPAQESKDNPLFAPLAQFITNYPAILRDFEAIFANKNFNESPFSDNGTALAALDAFEQLAGLIAGGYKDQLDTAVKTELQELTENFSPADYVFEVVLENSPDGAARIDVIESSCSGTNLQILPPVIEFDSFIRVNAPDKPADALASYNYVQQQCEGDTEMEERAIPLSYEKALNISKRIVTIKALSIFTTHTIGIQIENVRNGNAGKGERVSISDPFTFVSPTASFTEQLLPALTIIDFDLGSLTVSEPSLENYLNDFFNSLLGNAAAAMWRIKIEAAFSFEPEPGLPRTIVPIALIPPTGIELPLEPDLPLIDPLVETIKSWTNSNEFVPDTASEYNFRVEFFLADAANNLSPAPLLKIDNLFIKTAMISK